MTAASSSADHRYSVLDAWRGVCACLVTFVHIPVAHRWQGTAPFHNMQLFVDFFFVLSGFVIAYAYGERLQRTRDWPAFMIRRFGRVYPLHFAVLAAFFLQEVVKWIAYAQGHVTFDGLPFTGSRSVETLISNLLMTQSFGLHGMTSWNGPGWSIGVEFYTYIVFAIAVLTFGARPAVYLALSLLGLGVVASFSPLWLFGTHDFGFFRCLYGFFLGCLVSVFVKSRPQGVLVGLTPRLATSVEMGAILLLVAYLAVARLDATSLAAPLVFAVIVLVFSSERGAVSSVLRSAPAQALGLWSYSIYMIHMLLFTGLKSVFAVLAAKHVLPLTSQFDGTVRLWTLGNTAADMALCGFYLALVIVLARYTYAWIEAPARDWFGRLATEASAKQHSPALASAAR